MSSNEFTGSPSSSVWLDVGTTAASPSGAADSVAFGAHAANKAEPVTIPAALRKSRRERYCEYGVISDDLTGTDLNFVFMIFLIFIYSIPHPGLPQGRGDELPSPHGGRAGDEGELNMSLPTML